MSDGVPRAQDSLEGDYYLIGNPQNPHAYVEVDLAESESDPRMDVKA